MGKKLKVLFVASGNSKNFDIAPFIKAQGTSLECEGVDISYFPIKGKGITGYIKAVLKLHKYLKINKRDIIHAHYSLAGLTAILTFSGKPIVLSLMGDDAYGTYIGPDKVSWKSKYIKLTTLLIQPFISAFISKSSFIESHVYRKKKSFIIPNGIILEDFKPLSIKPKIELGLSESKQYILFLGDKSLPRKNYGLIVAAVDKIALSNLEILTPFPVNHADVVKYFNAADVFVMPAFMEGSPNVIKECMACNCPIVSTRVGDVEWVIGNTDGCYLADFNPIDFAEKIQLALQYAKVKGRTNGRDRIIKLGLDSESIAKRIIEVYNKIL